MQEFSSVTASSYDADALAPLLSAKSAEGWNVISIVSAGTSIVAYLSRDSGVPDVLVHDTIEDVMVVEDGNVVAEHIEAERQVFVNGEMVADDSISVDALDDDALGATKEPAGWGSEPTASVDELAAQVAEPAAAEPVVVEPVVIAPAAVEPVAEPAAVEPAAVEPAVAAAAAAVAAEPAAAAQAVQEAPPVESTVPAGWYADPSGRYELRYWDGTAWTEHVSRAGQQFTDPPVA